MRAHDPVERPSHYVGADGLEAIHIVEDWDLGFHLGNALTYILRHQRKDLVRDLAKARWYVRRETQRRRQGGIVMLASALPAISVMHVSDSFGLSPECTAIVDALFQLGGATDTAETLLRFAEAALDQEIARLQGGAA